MTQRGRDHWTTFGNNSQSVYELTGRGSKRRSSSESSEEQASEPDSAFIQESEYDGGKDSGGSDRAAPRFLQRLFAFMSQSPLLRHRPSGQGLGSYGAVPDQELSLSGHSSDVENIDTNDAGSRDKRKGKSLAVYPSVSTQSSGSRRSEWQDSSSSQSRKRRKRRGSAFAALYTEPGDTTGAQSGLPGGLTTISDSSSEDDGDYGEEAIDIHPPSDKGTPEDPWDNSPYPQVRASVLATDDILASISTPRMWILSLLCALLGSATNLFFSLRYPSVAITPVIALVVVHPLGRAWDKVLKRDDDPIGVFTNGVLDNASTSLSTNSETSKKHRFRLWLAQGRWNEKEHACVYISSNVSFGFAFATDIIVEQAKFYHQEPTLLYQLLLTISTQILGYSFAGLTRRYLVRPPSMIWPGTLMSTAMFTTMHKSENKPANGWNLSRRKFFILVWAAAFTWYFLPGLLMPALSYFNVITWFAPDNVPIANLFGVRSGLGLFPMTFDWAQVAYIGSPLLTPWWAAANVVGGLVVVMWFIAPIMYYKNALYSAYMPILSSSVFDNTGKPYDVSRILTSDFVFDREAYRNYSKVYLPITYVLSYAVQFAGLAALLTHTACWHGRDIWRQSKKSFAEQTRSGKAEYLDHDRGVQQNLPSESIPAHGSNSSSQRRDSSGSSTREDVHNRLMRRYDDVPMMWYLVTFVLMLSTGVFVVSYYPIHLPWYGLLLALSITALLFIPVGIVMALTNQHSSLYLICQLICGIVFPGRPVANMVFVTYCYISSAQGVKFSADLKLGHYMKIPPKLLFKVQMAATLVSSVTQIGVLNWMFAHIPSICTPEAVNGFTCPLARVHFNGSVLWGVVGPARFFGPGALYQPLIWAFPIGFICPILIFFISRRRGPKTLLQKINLPVLFGSLSWIPPATGLNFSIWALVCFLFNYVLRRRAGAWWGKYTMTLSAGLDSGLAVGVVVIFFAFVYPGWMGDWSWWGTEVYKQGCDWRACAYKTLKPGEQFGS